MGTKFLPLAFLPALLFCQNAPSPSTASISPLSVPEKFEFRVLGSFGPKRIVAIGFEAAYAQSTNTPGEWGRGAEGYGKRFASDFGTLVARQTFAFGLETALHQDPRYFPSGEKGFLRRTKYALKRAVIARTDSGDDQFAYARIGSALGASFLANAWQPPSTDKASTAMERFGITLAADAGFNFLQEFIHFLRPKELR
jgi:hypothetical protein